MKASIRFSLAAFLLISSSIACHAQETQSSATRSLTKEQQAALDEKAGVASWKSLPSWWVYGDADKNIPPQAMAFMAKRAGAKDVVVIKGASHVVMLSHPSEVAHLIEKAATAR